MTPLNMQVATTIGLLDRCLSELKEHAMQPELDAADSQTVKHHAEDCIGLGWRVLQIMRGKQSSPGFGVGDKVSKTGGDYQFDGTVVAAFNKLGGAPRYVVEDDRGVLHVYSANNLRLS